MSTAASSANPLGCSDCERIRDGWVAQPANAATSLAYVVAAGVVARRAIAAPDPAPVGALTYAALLAGVGLGSVAYHGPQPRGAQQAHDWPIVGLAALAVATPVLRRWRGAAALPGRTPRRGGALMLLAAGSAMAYAGGRTGSPTCDPDSVVQLHGAWHLGSATAFALTAGILYGPVPRGSLRP